MRDHPFLELVRNQVRDDLRRLPERVRGRTTVAGRVARRGSIAELRAAARRALPPAVYDFLDGAAGDELTLAANERAFRERSLVPRVLRDVETLDLSTTVAGSRLRLPIVSGPTGGTGLFHPDGEGGLATAAERHGTAYVLSSMASQSIEEVARGRDLPLWFQLYMWKDRGLVADLIDRAHAAGYTALVLTVDTPRAGARERDRRNGFSLPPRVTARSLAGGVLRPRWTRDFLRSPSIALANVQSSSSGPVDLKAYGLAQFDAGVTWEDLDWVRERWPGELLLKGVLSAEDARTAVAAGAGGVIVSNHGGRQLDRAPASLDVLAEVVDAVADDGDVLLDGGVRRGVDVVTALALGAKACLVGRAQLYGLATGGTAGAERALGILRDEIELTMTLMGVASVTDLDPSFVRHAAGARASTSHLG